MSGTLPAGPIDWNRRVWRLAGPIILSNLSAPLLGLTDTAVMGHLDSPVYLGGVAVGTLILNYLYWSFGFLRMGTTAFTAQASGRNDALELRAVLWRGLAVAGVIAFLLLLLQWPIFFVGLKLIGASDSVSEAARSFFFIRIWGAPAGRVGRAMPRADRRFCHGNRPVPRRPASGPMRRCKRPDRCISGPAVREPVSPDRCASGPAVRGAMPLSRARSCPRAPPSPTWPARRG